MLLECPKMPVSIKERLATIENQIKTIFGDLAETSNKFVTKDRFSPIEKIVWGLTMLVLTSVFVAIFKLVLNS